MKWIAAIFALVLLGLGILFFYPGSADVQEVDPNKPWLAMEPAPESSPDKEARADDPRSLDNRMLQRDFCAASDFFRYGRRDGELQDFLKKNWPRKEDEARDLNITTQPILAAQFARTREEAVNKLLHQNGADVKLLLGLFQAGLAGNFQGTPTPQELREALVSFDEAEDLNPTNSLIPIYRAMVMLKLGGKPEGVAAFLADELPKHDRTDSPLSAARLDYLGIVTRDPLLFAGAAPTFRRLEDSQLDQVADFLASLPQDQRLARLQVRVADQWQKSELGMLSPGVPDQFNQLDTVSLAGKIGRDAWGRAFPGMALPDRFDEKNLALQAGRHRDRNPIEAKLYFANRPEETCGPKWKEAVEADYEMIRDRLRKKAAVR